MVYYYYFFYSNQENYLASSIALGFTARTVLCYISVQCKSNFTIITIHNKMIIICQNFKSDNTRTVTHIHSLAHLRGVCALSSIVEHFSQFLLYSSHTHAPGICRPLERGKHNPSHLTSVCPALELHVLTPSTPF